jgi:cysteine-rich repeat protein
MSCLHRTPLVLTALLHLAACGSDPPATSGTDATSTGDTTDTAISGDGTTTDTPTTTSATGVVPTGDPTTDAPTTADTDTDPVCGDDSVGNGEDCDDGNNEDGDGCSAACVGEPGWQCDGSPSVCSDIDECADALDDCGENATCTNTPGGWDCACNPGYEGDGKRCEPSGATQVVTGDSYTCALLGGRVKCWGNNHYGQLGLGDDDNRGDDPGEMGDALPYVDLGADAVVVALSARRVHTCAALESGAVKCWGYNLGGQLGLGDAEDRGDDPDEMGDALPAVDLGAGAHAVAVTVGTLHSCALLQDSGVKCWGQALVGQLGLGDITPRGDDPGELGDLLPLVDLGGPVAAISAGQVHTCARLEGGAIKCWGDNSGGQLGYGDSNDRGNAPNEMGAMLPAVDLGDVEVIDVVGGGFGTCATLGGGALKCWGANDVGQLGLGDTLPRGEGPGQMGEDLPVVELGPKVVSVSANEGQACAVLAGGVVKCWGHNGFGQLGLGDTQTRGDMPGEMGDDLLAVDLGDAAVSVSVGWEHACAVLESGAVKCWGRNHSGQLGLGDEQNRGDGPDELGAALPAVEL